jgi:predicted nucleic acid-binding protein
VIIISDTSVVSNLILIDHLHILYDLFGEIIIPTAVKKEILRLEEYGIDLSKFHNSKWIKTKDPINKEMEKNLLESLDAGESAAITLAYELNADYLAIDERAGRRTAKSLGIQIIGLVGILIRGKQASGRNYKFLTIKSQHFSAQTTYF